METDDHAAQRRIPFALVTSSRATRLPLALTGLDGTLPLSGSVPEAVASLRAAGRRP